MKKAFEQNVSRAKPRLRLGALTGVTEPEPAAPARPTSEAQLPFHPPQEPDLEEVVRARSASGRLPRPSMAQALHAALEKAPHNAPASVPTHARADAEEAMASALRIEARAAAEVERARQGLQALAGEVDAPEAYALPPEELVEVQTPELPVEDELLDVEARRERLKERLKAVRENPRPEPLPPTVGEAGMLAVERIGALQTELHRMKSLNLALTQDLESSRRQAEKATEEARLRMEEAQRLASEMDRRVSLLQELERELASLEGERDEALLSLQEARQGLDAAAEERSRLQDELTARDRSLADTLSEEERLATELEGARDDADRLRRTVEALSSERDTLSRQVADLTSERAELLEARKALEAVHRALAHATAH